MKNADANANATVKLRQMNEATGPTALPKEVRTAPSALPHHRPGNSNHDGVTIDPVELFPSVRNEELVDAGDVGSRTNKRPGDQGDGGTATKKARIAAGGAGAGGSTATGSTSSPSSSDSSNSSDLTEYVEAQGSEIEAAALVAQETLNSDYEEAGWAALIAKVEEHNAKVEELKAQEEKLKAQEELVVKKLVKVMEEQLEEAEKANATLKEQLDDAKKAEADAKKAKATLVGQLEEAEKRLNDGMLSGA